MLNSLLKYSPIPVSDQEKKHRTSCTYPLLIPVSAHF